MAHTGRTQDTEARLALRDSLAGQVVSSAQELIDIQHIQRPLDRTWIRTAREEQTLARLAEIYLKAPASTDPVVFFRTAPLLAESSTHSKIGTITLLVLALRANMGRRAREGAVSRAAAWLDQAFRVEE
jgi:dephospho-CoA kinase